tara:strand:- start:42 stop:329 length:288 start_codon:yes stop_codon:yes gene_type:complete
MANNCKCHKEKKTNQQSINKMLDHLIEQKKVSANERLVNTMVTETLEAIADSMREKSRYPRLNQCGNRTKYSNDFVNSFEPLLRKKIVKMLKENV